MMYRTFIILTILLATIVLLGTTQYPSISNQKNLILHFLKENPDRTAIKLVFNDKVLARRNPNKLMPLASTVKIIIAIEYANQAAKGIIDPNETISLDQLDKYYIPNTDGGAHPSWLKNVTDKIENNHISIREIAKGMIMYSSNANTEWICEKLGLENINNRIDSLGIENHSEIFYLVSSLLVGKEKFPHLKNKELATSLKELSHEEYKNICNIIHDKLKQDCSFKDDIGDLGIDIQRIWSDNLPRSTVDEYVEIMRKINSRTYFDEKTHQYLDEVMEYLLENPTNKEWLIHAGMKGGSTAFVLTTALYATDKKGNKTELAYFMDDLGFFENIRLQNNMNSFELDILSSKEFREEVTNELKN